MREFLREQVQPGTAGRLSFHARVAANALETVERELQLGPALEARHRERLAGFGFVGTRAELAGALRGGTLDPEDPAVLAAVRGWPRAADR